MNAVASGSWLTGERVRAIALISGVAGLAMLAYRLLGGARHARSVRPCRSAPTSPQVWTAGAWSLDGRAAMWTGACDLAIVNAGVPRTARRRLWYGWHLSAALPARRQPRLRRCPTSPRCSCGRRRPSLASPAAQRDPHGPPRSWLFVLAAPVTLICVLARPQRLPDGRLAAGGGLMLLDRKPTRRRAAARLPGLQAAVRAGHCRCCCWSPATGARSPRRSASPACSSPVGTAIWGWPVWQAFLDSLPLTPDRGSSRARPAGKRSSACSRGAQLGRLGRCGLCGAGHRHCRRPSSHSGWRRMRRPRLRNAGVSAAVADRDALCAGL